MKYLVYAFLACLMLVLVSTPFTWPLLVIGGLIWLKHDSQTKED